MASHESETDIDAFCRGLLPEAVEWVDSERRGGKQLLLGERSSEESAAIIQSLRAVGVSRLYLVRVEEDEISIGAGGLVVVLPTEASARSGAFALLAGLAEEVGYDGDEDRGQSMEFALLD